MQAEELNKLKENLAGVADGKIDAFRAMSNIERARLSLEAIEALESSREREALSLCSGLGSPPCKTCGKVHSGPNSCYWPSPITAQGSEQGGEVPQDLPWDRLVAISDVPIVHEAIENFSHDSTEDNAVCMIREILKGAQVVINQDWICPECQKPKWSVLIGVTLDDGTRVCSARCKRARGDRQQHPSQPAKEGDSHEQ